MRVGVRARVSAVRGRMQRLGVGPGPGSESGSGLGSGSGLRARSCGCCASDGKVRLGLVRRLGSGLG